MKFDDEIVYSEWDLVDDKDPTKYKSKLDSK